MTMYHGLGMFILGMFAIIIGGMIAWYIINKVMKDDEEKYTSAFECKKHHLNAMGSLHGGMIMSFIDYTLFVICLESIKDQSFVTVSCSTEFLNPSINDQIIFGDGQITQETKSMIFIKGRIYYFSFQSRF